MKATAELHELGQSLWLDNITRGLLTSGTLRRYIDECSVTGLTSNPSIFDHAIENARLLRRRHPPEGGEGTSGEALFFELAIEDLRQAAELFRPVHDATAGLDGWVSLEVSPLLANDTASTIKAARSSTRRRSDPNLLIKIPGTTEGLAAIEESIAAGVPVNVTLLFSAEQYLAAADAYMRGIERRIAAGLDPNVGSVASMFISPLGQGRDEQVPTSFRIASASPSRSARTPPTAICSPHRAGRRCSKAGARRSACCGRAPARKTPRPPTCSTSKRSPRRTRSTPSPRRRCAPSADHGQSDRGDAGGWRRCGRRARPSSPRPASTSTALADQLQREGAAVVRRLLERSDEPASKSRAPRGRQAATEASSMSTADHRPPRPLTAPGLAGADEQHRAESRDVAPARAVRRGPRARRALHGGGRRAVPRLLEEPRSPTRRIALLVQLAEESRAARAHRGDVPRREDQRQRRSAPCSTSRCAARRASRSSSTATTSSPRSTRCSIGWRRSPTRSARARGRATPASRSATSSTSASAAPTSVR